MRLLLALDDPSDRLFLSRVLLARGDEAAVATDLQGLRAQAASGRLPAVVLGTSFCGEDGRAALAGLQALPAGSRPLLLVWCPDASAAWRREALAAGADDTLADRDPEEVALRLAAAARRAGEGVGLRALARLRAAFERAPDPMMLVSLGEGTITDANAAAADLLGRPAAALSGAAWSEVVAWSSDGTAPDPADLLRPQEGTRLVLRRADGSLHHAGFSAVAVPWEDAGCLLLTLARPQGQGPAGPPAPRESVHDPLTGLLNGPAFLERLRAAVRAAGRHRHPLSLAVLDIESFRAVNDRHGHLAGDEVLASVSDAIQKALRAEDLAGRVHGDTFALAFPFTSATGAAAAVERLRADIESRTFLEPAEGAPFQIRLRLAVVEQAARKAEAEELLEAARLRARQSV